MNNRSKMKIGIGMGFIVVAVAFISASASRAIQFVDIKSDAAYLSDVDQVVKWGVMGGKTNDTFAPDECVTRHELATALNRYNKYVEGKFVGMVTKVPKVEVAKPKATEMSLAKILKCTLEKHEYCLDGKCANDKKDYSILINFESKLISACNSWDCNRALFTKSLDGNVLTLKKRILAASGWSMEIDMQNKTFVETDKRIKGEFRSNGVCEIVN